MDNVDCGIRQTCICILVLSLTESSLWLSFLSLIVIPPHTCVVKMKSAQVNQLVSLPVVRAQYTVAIRRLNPISRVAQSRVSPSGNQPAMCKEVPCLLVEKEASERSSCRVNASQSCRTEDSETMATLSNQLTGDLVPDSRHLSHWKPKFSSNRLKLQPKCIPHSL